MPGNRSTSQMSQANTILPGDRAYAAREVVPGTWTDISFDPSLLVGTIYSQTVSLDTTNIEDLDTVDFEVVSAPGASQIIVPMKSVIVYNGYTTPWSTDDIVIGSSSLVNGSRYTLRGLSETGGVSQLLSPYLTTNLSMAIAGDGLSMHAFGPLTGGDSTWTVRTFYRLIDA